MSISPAKRRAVTLKNAAVLRDIKQGETFLASRRAGKLKLGLCSEDCRLEWDAEYWEMRAADREAEEGGR